MSRRRASLIAIVVLAVLASLVFLPALPPVRDLIVGQVVAALERGGTRVSYDAAEGNPWRGVGLRGARIEGPGVDVEVARLRVGYFLPSLIGGELPIDISVNGARGQVDLSQLLTGTAAAPGAPPGPVTVQLRRLELDDVEVDVEELPFTLPDATVSDLQVSQSGTAFDLAGTVTTADGSARLAGRYETLTGSLDARVERADATMARQWWQGVTAGEVTGVLRVRGQAITGTFDLSGGAVDDLGIVASGVSGRVELDYPVITADLTGDTLGGQVAATGVVNVAAQRWEARATGSAGLAEAAAWLLRGSMPDGPPVALAGSADVELRLSGWDHVALEGTANGDGTVEGVPVEGLSTAFRLPRDGRIRVEGRADLGGGPLRFEVAPGQGGDTLTVTADGVDLAGLQEGLGAVDARLRLALGGRDDGDMSLSWRGELAGRQAEARLDARLDPDGWQGFVTGSDSTGARLEGALVLAGGRVQGGLTLSSLGVGPLPDDAALSLGVSGPATLDGARLTLTLDADGPVTLPGLAPGHDLRGRASGVLQDMQVTGIVGQFGPLVVSGVLDLSPVALVADVIVEPTRLDLADGSLAPLVTVPASSLVFGPDGLSWRGRAAYADLGAGPVATRDGTLAGDVRVDVSAGTWRATAASESGDLSLEAGPDGVNVVLDGLWLDVADSEPGAPTLALAVSGQAVVPLADPGAAASVDLLVSDAGGGTAALPAELRLSGAAAPGDDAVRLTGALGDLPLELVAAWDGPLSVVAEVGPPGEQRVVVTYDAATGALTADGEADLAAYWRLVTGGELPAAVALSLDLSGRLEDGALTSLAGGAEVLVTAPVEARAVFTGRGDALQLDVAGEVAGLPVSGSGLVRPSELGAATPLLTLDVGPLEGLRVTASGASGAGLMPGVTAGPAAVPDLPWRLDATWSGAPTALVELAGTELRLTLDDGELVASGPVVLPVTYAGEELTLTVELEGGRVPSGDLAAAPLRAALSRPGEAPLLEAGGTLGEVSIKGLLPADLLAAPLPAAARPRGVLTVTGTADLLGGQVDLSVDDALTVRYAGGAVELRADRADLAPRLPEQAPTGLQAVIDGALRYDPAAGWDGELRAELGLPGEEPTAATLTLSGAGPEVAFALAATGPLRSALRVSGTLAPEPRLTGDAEALAGAITGTIVATPADGLTLELSSTALVGAPYLEVPPLRATLALPVGGDGPSLAGDWVDVRLEGGALSGRVELPFTLLGEPALLTADLTGTLSDPRATATLAGAGVAATAVASLESATAELTLTEPALSAALPEGASAAAALVASPVAARAAWTPDGGWSLAASARAEPPGAGPVDLALTLAGEGAAYEGELAASLPGAPGEAPVAVAVIAGEGADLTAELDLATVDVARIGAAYGVAADLAVSGRAFLGTDPTTTELTVDAAGTIGGAEVSLRGSAPDDLSFRLRAQDVDVTGRLAWNERRRVVVSGRAAGRPVEAWLEVDDAFENGRLHVDVPGAAIEAVLASPEPGVRTARVEGSVVGGPAGLSGEFGGEVVAEGGEVRLDDLNAALTGVPGLDGDETVLLAGSGTLAPQLRLEGTLSASGGPLAAATDAGVWRLGGVPLELSVGWLGVEAAYVLASGEAQLRPTGDVAPAVAALAPGLAGTAVRLEGEGLSWSRQAGFTGALTLSASGGPVPAEAEPLTAALRGLGGGDLGVALRAGSDAVGGPLVALDATVPSDLPLTGALAARVDVAGAVEASGQVTAGAGGVALELAGEGLALRAAAGADGWSVSGTLDALPVADLLPLREDPRLSLRLSGGSATGGLAFEDLVVASGASRLTGSASYDGRLRLALRAQVDLADLDLGETRLTGLLRGPVVLVAPRLQDLAGVTVTAQLDAAGVGLRGVPAQVDGAVQVGGTVGDPVVFATLTGSGDLRGSLRLEAAPRRGRADVRSTLAFRDVSSDLRVSVAGDDVIASGSLRAGDAVLLVSDEGGELALTGAGRLDGWRGVVAGGLGGITVQGPLSAVSPSLGGEAEVALGAPAGAGAWLRGGVSGLSVAGQVVGDVSVTSPAAGAPVTLAGAGLAAAFDPSDQTWRADLSGIALPAALALDLEASGRGAEGRATGRLTGGAGLGVDVGLDLGLDAGGATVAMSGAVLGSELTVSGRKPAAGDWTGEVTLQGAGAAGDGEAAVLITATGVLQGDQLVPQVVLATAAYAGDAGVAAAGRVAVGPAGVTVDQTFALPQATAPVRVQGRVAPGLDLRLGASGSAAGQPRGEVRLLERPDGLAATGELEVPLGPVTVRLGSVGTSRSPQLSVTPHAVPDATLTADLAADDLAELLARVARDGLVVTGTGAASGTALLTLSGGGALELRDLGVNVSGFQATLSGTLSAAAADLSGAVELPLDAAARADRVLPVAVSSSGGEWRLTSEGRLGDVAASYDASSGAAILDVALELPAAEDGAGPLPGVTSGSVTARLAYEPGRPPTGTLTVSGVRLAPPGWGEVTVNADAALADGRVGGAATVSTEAGSLTLSGDAPLTRLLGALGGGSETLAGPGAGDVEVRLRAVELSSVPAVAAVAPHLTGALSGVVRLQGDFVFGQLIAPDLAVGEKSLPLSVQLSGPSSRVDAAVLLGSSLLSLTLSDLTLAGSARLERFPLDLLAEAVVGPSDVTAFLTGVARVDLPLTDPGAGYVALASEELTLERAGVVTRGELTLVFDQGALNVERATFSGRGDWYAGGVLSPDRLDFELVADEADFGPMLGLVPTLALYGVGAEGSFTFSAAGSLAEPQVSFQTDSLDFEVAGTRYRLSDADVSLDGLALSAQATFSALQPVEGDLRLEGDATLALEPLALRAADLRFAGALVVPGLGRIDDVSGAITQDPQFRPYVALTGRLGAPVTVQGTLVPLDLRAGGTGLRVSYPGLLIADSTLSADVRLVGGDGGVTLSGAIAADEVVIDPSVSTRAAAPTAPTGAAADAAAAGEGTEPAADTSAAAEDGATDPSTAGQDAGAAGPPGAAAQAAEDPRASTLEPAGVAPSPVTLAPEPAPSGALAGLRFDDLRITAPQRVVMSTSFASLEAALDLTLSGTGADPRLSGEARALRGNLRFSGREFTVDQAVASFSANRGVLPDLDVRAHTVFEKARVLTGSSDVEFVAPEGRTFRVDLAFSGPVELDERGGVRFDVRPTLTSEAIVEVGSGGAPASAAGGGVRPLTEAELLSLVTLGRLELGSDLIGAGGLGGAVAQGALDTAVDVFLLGELQNALREALGLDVLEIRTSAISGLLEGGEPFGVSVRLGGYLNPELFASYRIGTADPDDPGFAVTNEVALNYALGPLDLEVSGRIDFPMTGVLASPRSELGLGLSYDVSRSLGLDLSSSLSTERSRISFGVTLRW